MDDYVLNTLVKAVGMAVALDRREKAKHNHNYQGNTRKYNNPNQQSQHRYHHNYNKNHWYTKSQRREHNRSVINLLLY